MLAAELGLGPEVTVRVGIVTAASWPQIKRWPQPCCTQLQKALTRATANDTLLLRELLYSQCVAQEFLLDRVSVPCHVRDAGAPETGRLPHRVLDGRPAGAAIDDGVRLRQQLLERQFRLPRRLCAIAILRQNIRDEIGTGDM